jgi:hypothetical protein
MAELFDSCNESFEDGDILFVTHRMKLAGPKGPMPPPALQGKVTGVSPEPETRNPKPETGKLKP